MRFRTRGRPSAQEYRLRLKRPAPSLGKPRGTFKSSTRLGELAALALAASFRGSLSFASLSPKNMSQHIFQFESELQNNFPEAAPSSRSLSPTVSEKLARYGSSALSGLEHLTLLVGKEDLALALIQHFGSIKALSRASLQQLRQFLPQRKAEAVMAAFSVSLIAESEHARSNVFDNPESVSLACADMKLFNQEVLRVVLLDTRQRLITMIDVTKGGLNESLAHCRDIFRPVISFSAHSFILVHNHPSGVASPSEADLRLTRRLNEAARILQIQMLDHVIIGQPMNDRPGYFSFKEAGTIG
jgi:DNA repair protein RadC